MPFFTAVCDRLFDAGFTLFCPDLYDGRPATTVEPAAWVTEVETALRQAGAAVKFHRYPGTRHWFAEPDRPEYEPAAAEQAWTRTMEFLPPSG